MRAAGTPMPKNRTKDQRFDSLTGDIVKSLDQFRKFISIFR